MISTVLAVLAHQGGWDEILLVGVPIVAIAGALWVAKRRVDATVGAGEPAERADGIGDDGDSLVE